VLLQRLVYQFRTRRGDYVYGIDDRNPAFAGFL